MEANQTVSGMVQIPTTVFHIPDEELKAFYLKEAFLLDPQACDTRQSEYWMLMILQKRLKRILALLSMLNSHPWYESLVSIQTVNGFYLTQDNISREERLKVNSDLLKHQKIIAYISSKQNISQELHMLINKHYLNVTRLLKQFQENTRPE